MFSHHEELLTGPGIDSESEALQTDIQRFIAILGFCLMAIFSLVQSIPVTSPKNKAVIEDLGRKLESQNRLLEKLQVENLFLKNEIELFKEAAVRGEGLKESHEQLQEKLAQQFQRISILMAEQIKDRENLHKFSQTLEKRDSEIRKIKHEKIIIEQLLTEFAKKAKAAEVIKSEKDRLEKLVEKISASKQAEFLAKRKKPEDGIYVAFASDQAFMDLLSNGKIQLYIMMEHMNEVFRILQRNGVIDFKIQRPSEGLDLWKIGESQVPDSIMNSFREWTTLASREKTLIVGLSPEISRPIRKSSEKSGRFIIESDGKVIFSRLEK